MKKLFIAVSQRGIQCRQIKTRFSVGKCNWKYFFEFNYIERSAVVVLSSTVCHTSAQELSFLLASKLSFSLKLVAPHTLLAINRKVSRHLQMICKKYTEEGNQSGSGTGSESSTIFVRVIDSSTKRGECN